MCLFPGQYIKNYIRLSCPWLPPCYSVSFSAAYLEMFALCRLRNSKYRQELYSNRRRIVAFTQRFSCAKALSEKALFCALNYNKA